MTLNSKAMVGVRVETRSGFSVGKVASFDFAATTGRLVALRVKTRGLVSGLLSDELVVSQEMIVEMTNARVIVADAVLPTKGLALAATTKPATPTPSLLREEV